MDPASLVLLAVVMAIFYFMLVRPQKKRLKEHKDLISALEPGDEVVTIGGAFGFVNKVDEEMVWLEVSDGVEVRFTKQAVSRRILDSSDQLDPEPGEEPAQPEPEAEAEQVGEQGTSA